MVLKKKLGLWIVIITSIALTGVLVMQLFWVRHAVDVKRELFEHRVNTALRSVVNKLTDYKFDAIYPELHKQGEYCRFSGPNFLRFVNQQLLDSLLLDALGSLGVDQNFEYGVYQNNTGSMVMGRVNQFDNKLKGSVFHVSLDCLDNEHSISLSVFFPGQTTMIIRQMQIWIVLSGIFMVLVMSGFAFTMYSWLQQKKIARMKSDFVNNMTHEFKTPIATISLSSEMLLKPEVSGDVNKTARYAHIIYEENYRLKKMVEQVLQTAVLEKGELILKPRSTDLHKLLDKGIHAIEDMLRQRGGVVYRAFQAQPCEVEADRIHIGNVISNLLDNACKYSFGSPEITVGTQNLEQGVLFWVRDKGIGIGAEHKKHVFKQFYRGVSGDVHQAGGFGIGLFYVKSIVEAHGGHVNFISELKKGSTFEVFLPYKSQYNQKHSHEQSED